MKFYITIIGVITSVFGSAQNIKIDTLLTDKISVRAITISKGKVWYAGSKSKFGFVNIKKPQKRQQIQLNDLNQEFRVIANFNNRYFETINVGAPAKIYRISPQLQVTELRSFTDPSTFFDTYVINPKNKQAMAISDPLPNGQPYFYFADPTLVSIHKKELPSYAKGEAHFAASNSNIAMRGNQVWIATGGSKARIFKFNWDNPYQWKVYNTGFVQGQATTGIYSIDFINETFGVAVGGDYTQQSDNINNIATTSDGGKTWQIQASGHNAGYSTVVRIKPGSDGRVMLALGDQHISYSGDFGKTWRIISEEKGFYTAEWLDEKTIILAGKDKISKLTFLD